MNRKTTILLALILLAVGAGVLLYPTVSDYVNQRNGSYAIQNLSDRMARTDLEEHHRLAQEYNAAIAAGELPENYDDIMDFGNDIMGVVEIPKIRVELPIYHGVGGEALSRGVGHLPQSAFPIGGEGNHPVLTGHTGYPGARLFDDLTELEAGDRFSIRILENTLMYQVDQIKVVLPSDVADLAPVPGVDYCTLVTCTPYGINSHRLLVRGIRVEPEIQAQAAKAPDALPPAQVMIGIGVGGALLLWLGLRRQKKEHRKEP